MSRYSPPLFTRVWRLFAHVCVWQTFAHFYQDPEHPEVVRSQVAQFRVREEAVQDLYTFEDVKLALSNMSSSSGANLELCSELLNDARTHGFVNSADVEFISKRDPKLKGALTLELGNQVVEQAPDKKTKLRMRVRQKERLKKQGVTIQVDLAAQESTDSNGEQSESDGEEIDGEMSRMTSLTRGVSTMTGGRRSSVGTDLVAEDSVKDAMASVFSITSDNSFIAAEIEKPSGRRLSVFAVAQDGNGAKKEDATEDVMNRVKEREEENEKKEAEKKKAMAKRTKRASLGQWWEGSGLQVEGEEEKEEKVGEEKEATPVAVVPAAAPAQAIPQQHTPEQQQQQQQQQQYYAAYYAQHAVQQQKEKSGEKAAADGSPPVWTEEDKQKYVRERANARASSFTRAHLVPLPSSRATTLLTLTLAGTCSSSSTTRPCSRCSRRRSRTSGSRRCRRCASSPKVRQGGHRRWQRRLRRRLGQRRRGRNRGTRICRWRSWLPSA